MSVLPVALLPDLLELEANLPADPTTFFAAAFDPSAPPAPGARAAAEVLRHAASQGLETADLLQHLRMLGLGEAGAIFFANYWAAQPSRASLQREPPLQLLDVDWSFGVSASSSEHQAMGTTFVQLRLSTQGQNGGEFVHTGALVARPPAPRATRDSLSLSLSLPTKVLFLILCVSTPFPIPLQVSFFVFTQRINNSHSHKCNNGLRHSITIPMSSPGGGELSPSPSPSTSMPPLPSSSGGVNTSSLPEANHRT